MEKLLLVTGALEIIEANLTEELKTDDIAKALYCSKSSLEKLFKYVTRLSIKDYSIRRRMSNAARDLEKNPEVSLLDLAVKYGYGSNEAFTRAFRSVWHTNPSEYRKNPNKFELFPPIRLEQELMEDGTMSTRKKVDISELYDQIKARKNCYVVGVDIKSLIPINDISIEAGDIAILTAMKRLEAAAGEEDIVFRIGGDEFVAITNSECKEYADKIVEEILSHNGEPILYQGQKIPLHLYAVNYKIETKNIRYAQLFSTMQKELDNVK